MLILSKQFPCWLNLWLIFTLLAGLLSPALPAWASSSGGGLATRSAEASLVNDAKVVAGDEPAWVVDGSANQTDDANTLAQTSARTPQTFPLAFNSEQDEQSPAIQGSSFAAPSEGLSIQPSPAAQTKNQFEGLLFIENVGQFDPKARFMVHGAIGNLLPVRQCLVVYCARTD